MKDVRVALAQIECRLGKLGANLEKHRHYAELAAQAGARLICFPELSLTGYPFQDSIVPDLAQPLKGELGESIRELSRSTGLLILAGLLERGPRGAIFNTQLVARPGGRLDAYRKTHSAGPELSRFHLGQRLPLFSHAGLRFGVQICYDNHFPESARSLSLRGADAIFSPYASPGPCTSEGLAAKHSRWLRYLPARTFDNSVYLLLVNQVGGSAAAAASPVESTPRDTHSDLAEFPGGSMVLNPWGEVMCEAKPLAEDLVLVKLQAAVLEEKRKDPLQFFNRFRRPELYEELFRTTRRP